MEYENNNQNNQLSEEGLGSFNDSNSQIIGEKEGNLVLNGQKAKTSNGNSEQQASSDYSKRGGVTFRKSENNQTDENGQMDFDKNVLNSTNSTPNGESQSNTQSKNENDSFFESNSKHTLAYDAGVQVALDAIFDEDEESFTKFFEENGLGSREEATEGKKRIKSMLIQRLREEDLEKIRGKYPFVTAKSVEELPDFQKYASLRRKSLDAVESFEASSQEFIFENMKKRRTESGHKHLKILSDMGKSNSFLPIPKEELSIWQSAFPKDNLSELTKKYNKTTRRKNNV